MRAAVYLFLGLLAASAHAAEPQAQFYQAGDFVVVTRRADLKIENKVVDTVEEGVLLGVDRAEGEWLWVTSKRPGWLHRSLAIPAKEAVDYFSRAIRREPANAKLYARRGVARALNANYEGAVSDYDQALRLNPAEAVYYGDRGCFFLVLGDFDRAIADFAEEIKRIDSEDAGRRVVRLDWLKQRMSEAESLKASDSTVTLGPQ